MSISESTCTNAECSMSGEAEHTSSVLSQDLKDFHMELVKTNDSQAFQTELRSAPIFSTAALEAVKTYEPGIGDLWSLSQFGFIGVRSDDAKRSNNDDDRLFVNTTSPSSTFICGSQGSGKSHTLSCLLENYLVPSSVATLPHPLTGILFHYDMFVTDSGGSPCEAAFLASNKNLKVRVLCSPTNITTIKETYSRLNVTVEALAIDESNLNTKRMLDLMAVSQIDGPIPLYMHIVTRILRDMRIRQQQTREKFNYQQFKHEISNADLTPAQLVPLNQRLDTLESFMPKLSMPTVLGGKLKQKVKKNTGNDWASKPSQLTIVDLSCPCISPATACALFNICLSIFLEQVIVEGRVVALDEAHKYMMESPESDILTNTLLSTVRLQRHLGVRVVIATQEPNISHSLLDLCSITVVHRFQSPEWLRILERHIAISSTKSKYNHKENEDADTLMNRLSLENIVSLRAGEAFLFAPTAIIEKPDEVTGQHRYLGSNALHIRIRKRLTEDGGKSVFAT